MNFDEDVRDQIVRELPHKPEHRAMLVANSTNKMLIDYFNWRGRFVSTAPRTVHLSSVLKANPLARDARYKPALDQIMAFVQQGTSLEPHLSRGVKKGFIPGATPNKADRDLLLNDWGIHHLHLSTQLDADGFVTRTRDVLFARFTRADAYLIDILGHQDSQGNPNWAEPALVEIIISEWPDSGAFDVLHGFRLIEPPRSKQDLLVIRNHGLMRCFEFNGQVYVSRNFMATSGVSGKHVDAADTVCRAMLDITLKLQADSGLIDNLLRQNGIIATEPLDLHFEIFPDGTCGLVERLTRTRIPLTQAA